MRSWISNPPNRVETSLMYYKAHCMSAFFAEIRFLTPIPPKCYMHCCFQKRFLLDPKYLVRMCMFSIRGPSSLVYALSRCLSIWPLFRVPMLVCDARSVFNPFSRDSTTVACCIGPDVHSPFYRSSRPKNKPIGLLYTSNGRSNQLSNGG